MEHLKVTHKAIPEVEITRVFDTDIYSQAIPGRFGENDYGFRKFLEFPELHGWKLDPEYRLVASLDCDDPSSPACGKAAVSPLADKLAGLLQTWLFFGLIYTVVKDERGPILNFEGLSPPDQRYVTTEHLEKALETARDHVKAMKDEDHDAARLYMIQLEGVLHHAKMVVRKNCAQDPDPPHKVRYGLNPQQPHLFVTDELALSLMVLGERLASWKARLMHDTNTFIRGWHKEEEDEGWGPPRLVFDRMKNDGWCNRTVRILQSQLRCNATLLLAAYLSDRNRDKGGDPSKSHICKGDDCRLEVSEGYATGHAPHHHNHEQCDQVKPNMNQVLRTLVAGDVPLLVIKRSESSQSYDLEVKSLPKSSAAEHFKFGAISHVWADGWGNEDDNWIRTCQIGLIFQVLAKAAAKANVPRPDKTRSIPFWMDTLLIPVINQFTNYNKILKKELGIDTHNARTLRTRAIGQIGTVFARCEFTVVLDNRLCCTKVGSLIHYQSMAILASNWMKRLWTLQEAVLSKRIFIVVKFGDREDDGILDLDEIMDGLSKLPVNGSGCKAFADITRKHLADSIMNSGRPTTEQGRDGFTMAVDSWKAARWRDTTNAGHEPLALATLMGLDYETKGSKIKLAGLERTSPNSEKYNNMFREFWELFNDTHKGDIPPGLIFLPGEKLGVRGFGWAPRTFMQPTKLDYPDPFIRGPQTQLDQNFGLRVRYPGVVLHCAASEDLRKSILAARKLSNQPFRFAINDFQGYAMETTDDKTFTSLERIMSCRTQLAIILTRPHPREYPKEIGLLVEIYNDKDVDNESSRGQKEKVYYCQTIRRVRVWHDSTAAAAAASGGDGEMELNYLGRSHYRKQVECVGEVLDVNQLWYVDGVVAGREHGLPAFRQANKTGHKMLTKTFERIDLPARVRRSAGAAETQETSQGQVMHTSRRRTNSSQVTAPTPGIRRPSTFRSFIDTVKVGRKRQTGL